MSEFHEHTGVSSENGLYYDINGLNTEMLNWHIGQGDAIYAVGSSWNAGLGVERKLLERAVVNLNMALAALIRGGIESSPDGSGALEELIGQLEYQLDPF